MASMVPFSDDSEDERKSLDIIPFDVLLSTELASSVCSVEAAWLRAEEMMVAVLSSAAFKASVGLVALSPSLRL